MKKEFLQIKNKEELASFLNISIKQLDYNAYNVDERYTSFSLPKRNGGVRNIQAPIPSLKEIQKILSLELCKLYKPKSQVHSFIKTRAIRTGAVKHINKRLVINIDLENFFPSINFGRVRGVFLKYPFNFSDEVANILAQLSCQDNKLPQGSPLSPVLSNLICRKLDNDLRKLCKKHKLHFTRYADDITFSTNLKKVSSRIINFDGDNQPMVGEDLSELISRNGFKVNVSKVSTRKRYEHQYVTGLVVNEKLNVKRKLLKEVRAMLYAYEKFGLKNAASEHFLKYSKRHRGKKDEALFLRIIEGKLLFISDIRGKNDSLYKSLLSKYQKLTSVNKLQEYLSYQENKILIYTEGNTDWMHLEMALQNLSKKHPRISSLQNSIEIVKYDPNYSVGDSKLKNILEGYLISPQKNPIIAIFDSDQLQKLGEFAPTAERRYNNFNNRVFTFYLPKPYHRKTTKNCIEHFYLDSDLKKADENGRRLFLSNEFSDKDGKLNEDNSIHCSLNPKKLREVETIIDNNVWNSDGQNLALSKKDFAIKIQRKSGDFKEVDFKSFRSIFQIIHDIIVDYQSQEHYV